MNKSKALNTISVIICLHVAFPLVRCEPTQSTMIYSLLIAVIQYTHYKYVETCYKCE